MSTIPTLPPENSSPKPPSPRRVVAVVADRTQLRAAQTKKVGSCCRDLVRVGKDSEEEANLFRVRLEKEKDLKPARIAEVTTVLENPAVVAALLPSDPPAGQRRPRPISFRKAVAEARQARKLERQTKAGLNSSQGVAANSKGAPLTSAKIAAELDKACKLLYDLWGDAGSDTVDCGPFSMVLVPYALCGYPLNQSDDARLAAGKNPDNVENPENPTRDGKKKPVLVSVRLDPFIAEQLSSMGKFCGLRRGVVALELVQRRDLLTMLALLPMWEDSGGTQ